MACTHIGSIDKALLRQPAGVAHARGCEECVKVGGTWVHLRECLVCGYVGCCDSSAGRHATKHFHATKHPTMRTVEPGEQWGWCYIDGEMLQWA